MVIVRGCLGVLVSEKFAESPYTLLVTVYDPAAPLAVALTEAVPFAVVTALPADSAALAPDSGAVNVTVTPLRGTPQGSVSVTVKGFANAELTIADWGEPDEAIRVDPEVFRVTSLMANAPGEDPDVVSVKNSTVEMPPALSSTPTNGAEPSPALLSVPEMS